MELGDSEQFRLLLEEKRYNKIIGLLNDLIGEVKNKSVSPNINVEPQIDLSGVERVLQTLGEKKEDSKLPMSIKALGDVLQAKIDQIKFPEPPRPVKGYKMKVERDIQDRINIINIETKY